MTEISRIGTTDFTAVRHAVTYDEPPSAVGSLVAHAVGHSIIRAAVGAHELEVSITSDWDSDYVSRSSLSSWASILPTHYDGKHERDVIPFLNHLCIHVAGFVGEEKFGHADSLVDTSTYRWFRVGRQELQDAYEASLDFANEHAISQSEVLKACMALVKKVLDQYEAIAWELCRELDLHGRADGTTLAAILAGVKEEDLSQKVLELLGVNSGPGSGGLTN